MKYRIRENPAEFGKPATFDVETKDGLFGKWRRGILYMPCSTLEGARDYVANQRKFNEEWKARRKAMRPIYHKA